MHLASTLHNPPYVTGTLWLKDQMGNGKMEFACADRA